MGGRLSQPEARGGPMVREQAASRFPIADRPGSGDQTSGRSSRVNQLGAGPGSAPSNWWLRLPEREDQAILDAEPMARTKTRMRGLQIHPMQRTHTPKRSPRVPMSAAAVSA